MSKLPDELKDILDTVVYDLRFGATSKRRVRNLVANASRDGRIEISLVASNYLHESQLRRDDPLVEEVVETIIAGLNSAPRAPREVVRSQSTPKGRDFKGRELSRVPSGLRLEYDGAFAVVRGGRLRLDDGHIFDFISPAARHVTGQSAVNGWFAWRVVDDGRHLGDYYDENGL